MNRTNLPTLAEIPEAYLDRRGVVHLKIEADLVRRYEGPIEVGAVFAWEPDLPHARELVVVCEIAGDGRVWTLRLDSPMRGQEARWRRAMTHVARSMIEGAPVWNDEARFREAVVPTFFKPQKP